MRLRELLDSVRDQGNRQTCLSLAMSDGHHAARGVAPPLAADYLHFNAAAIDGVGVNDAVSAPSAIAAMLDHGQPAESECPYSSSSLPNGWKPPVPSGEVWRRRTNLERQDVWKTIINVVSADKPVVLIMQIDDAFWDPVDGVIDVPSAAARAMHAVLAVAAHRSSERVLVRNSWGEDRGDLGHAWISSAYLGVRCAAVITFGGSP